MNIANFKGNICNGRYYEIEKKNESKDINWNLHESKATSRAL